MTNKLIVTKKNALEMGRLLGLKEAFEEIKKISDCEKPFLEVYLKMRLQNCEKEVEFLSLINDIAGE